MSLPLCRQAYAAMVGLTVGDRVRLGDTGLLIEVERDYAVYGEECKFGGGKTLRDGMGQTAGIGPDEALYLLITNALVLDYTGIYKTDVGIKGGRIVGLSKAGNPHIMPGVTTEVVAGEGYPGCLYCHTHSDCPREPAERLPLAQLRHLF